MLAAACLCSSQAPSYAVYAQDAAGADTAAESGAAWHSTDDAGAGGGQDTSASLEDDGRQNGDTEGLALQQDADTGADQETETVQKSEDGDGTDAGGKDTDAEDDSGLDENGETEHTGSLETKTEEGNADSLTAGTEKENTDGLETEPEENTDVPETGADEEHTDIPETGADEENTDIPETGTDEDGAGGEDAEGEYTDSSGVLYKYRTNGGAADIYEISGCDGKDISIPAEINGCPVKSLTMSMRGVSVSSLTVPETVCSIKDRAFAEMEIGELFYNAADAGDMENTWSGPFSKAQIGLLSTGTGVQSIPAGMFSQASFSQESLTLDIPSVRDGAFRNASFNKLTVGDGVSYIGKQAFSGSSMEKLNYIAAGAEAGQTEYFSDTMLYNAQIGELEIGGIVKKLPYGFMCGAKLTQDALEIPDSVEAVGDYAFFAGMESGNISIGELTIGKNASRLGDYIFGNCKIGRCVINLLKAPGSMTSYIFTQPECGSVEAHRLGVYFGYFTAKTEKENITVLCRDFEISYLPEVYNAEKDAFVRRVDTKCTECGHLEMDWEYSRAVTVVFAGHDGTELSRQVLHPGEDAEAPENVPEREGHVFAGWDKDFTNVTENLTVTAQYEANRYTVTFKNGDHVVSRQETAYGSAATAPDAPEREGYVFTGWDKDFSNITCDMTVTAQYRANVYTVIFFDGTEELSRQQVEYGAAPAAPEAPVHEGRLFTGWDKDFSRVAKAMAVFAQYEPVYLTVTFMDGEKVLDTQETAYGSSAEAPEAPEKKGYVFTGWDADFTNVTKDLTVTAQYRQNKYTVIFKDGEKELGRQEVPYGGNASAPEAPKHEGSVFTGWDTDFTSVAKDLTVTAQYRKNQYTVIFKDGEKELCRQEVAYGGNASAPEAPKHEGNVFTGWDADFTKVTKDLTVTAQFKINRYLVRFWNGEKILGSQKVEHGSAASAPENPVREADGAYTYVFDGWDCGFESVTGDLDIHAVFVKKKIQQKPDSSGDTKKPDNSGDTKKPEKPDSSGDTKKPGSNGSSEKPDSNGDIKKPDSNGSSEKPGSNGDTKKPDSSGDTEKPGSSGDTKKPGGNGSSGKPGSNGSSGKPDSSGGAKKTGSSFIKPEPGHSGGSKKPGSGTGNTRPGGGQLETAPVQKITGAAEAQPGAGGKNTDGTGVPDSLTKQHGSAADGGAEKIQKSKNTDHKLAGEKESGRKNTLTDNDTDADGSVKESSGTNILTGRTRHIITAAAALLSVSVLLFLAWLLFRMRRVGAGGTVCSRDGEPLCGVEITLSDADGNRCRTAVTDENGCFHFGSRRQR